MAPSGLPLREFLKLITSEPSKLSMTLGMQAAGKLIPAGFNTLESLQTQTKGKYIAMGLPEVIAVELMKLKKNGKGKIKKARMPAPDPMILPDTAVKEAVASDLDFDEIEWEPTLMLKSCVTNRSPVMTLWATIVAERLGFDRQSALSLASAYNALNATTKGVSLGIIKRSELQGEISPNQPYIELMGRKVPIITTQGGQIRALDNKSQIISPSQPYRYVFNAMRQQMGAVAGSMRILANSFKDPEELNREGYSLYVDFRPENAGWGEKVEMKCSTILSLKKPVEMKEEEAEVKEENKVKVEIEEEKDSEIKSSTTKRKNGLEVDEKPIEIKRPKLELEEEDLFGSTKEEEEFEAALCLL